MDLEILIATNLTLRVVDENPFKVLLPQIENTFLSDGLVLAIEGHDKKETCKMVRK